ncbi:MAG: S-layer homology domain-containing protein, partial [Clostridiales bacterium]
MKKRYLLLLSLIFVFVFSSTALAEVQKVNIGYNQVINKDINIDNYTVRGSSRDKAIILESRLVDYLAKNNLSIKMTFLNSGQTLTISGKALQTKEYLDAVKSGKNIQVRINVFSCGDSLLSKYFKESEMNAKGLYSEAKTAFKISAVLMADGMKYEDYKSFAAPLKMTSGHQWGKNIYANSLGLKASDLHYYYVGDLDNYDVYKGYQWQKAAGSYDAKQDTVSANINQNGFYCALAGKKHNANIGDNTNSGDNPGTGIVSPTGFADLAGHWSESDVQYLQSIAVIKNEGQYYYPKKDINRGEYAVYLVRLLNLPEDLSSAGKFKDLNSSRHYYKEVLTAAANGLIEGRSAGLFAPEEKITRQEMAAMMSR